MLVAALTPLLIACYCNCCVANVFTPTDDDDAPLLAISTGQVRGLTLRSREGGRGFRAFRGIPYANAPVGELRFKPPEPVTSWNTIFDATKLGPECPQYNFIFKGLEGDEDCLVLNVYTPKIQSKPGEKNVALLPVMVFIHGGGFVIGSGSHSSYGPDKFMDYDVVLVTINYRLGILGFLNTEDDVATGNYGMLDQVQALRWVQQNIAHFGGDLNRVTLFGESAGSASVIYHMMSPLSTGLFHAAIAQSGSPLNFWGLQQNPFQHAKRLAEEIGCPTNDAGELIKCFRTASIKQLIKTNARFQVGSFFPFFAAPTIDKHSKTPFLSEDPLTLLKSGRVINKVPLIMGLMKDEGYAFYKDIENTYWFKPRGLPFFESEFPLVFPHFVNTHDVSVKNSQTAIRTVRREYFGSNDLFMRDIYEDGLTTIFGDAMFNVGVTRTLDLLVGANVTVMAYLYTHVGQHSFSELFGASPGKYSSHADDLYIQFSFNLAQASDVTPNDKKMTKVINSLWTSFATNRSNNFNIGDKLVNWPLYNAKDKFYLELNTEPTTKQGSFCEKVGFWINDIPSLLNNVSDFRKTEL